MARPNPLAVFPKLMHAMSRSRDTDGELIVSSFRRAPWNLADLGLGLAIILACRFLPAFYYDWFNWLPEVPRFIVVSSIPMLVLVLTPKWLAKARQSTVRMTAPDMSMLLQEAVVAIPVVLAIVVVVVITNVVYNVITGDSLGTVPRVAYAYSQGEVVAYLLMSFTVTPIAEEVFFRGFLYNVLRKYFRWAAIVIQAILFAMAHRYNAVQLMVVFASGLFLAAVYDLRKTLLTPILVHTAINAIWAFLLLGYVSQLAHTPYLGVAGEPADQGYQVTAIVSDSPAAAAELAVGDVVMKVGDTPISDHESLVDALREHNIGDNIRIHFLRDGQPHEVTVLLTKRPERNSIRPS